MDKAVRIRLILMNFFQWAVWGAYLTSMGSYLVSVGLAERIGLFYAMQGIVSIFMPAVMGIVADNISLPRNFWVSAILWQERQ